MRNMWSSTEDTSEFYSALTKIRGQPESQSLLIAAYKNRPDQYSIVSTDITRI